MNLQMRIKDEEYAISFERVNQWCGCNVILKNKLLHEIERYFSSSKYGEWETEPNLRIDGNPVGRKYFTSYVINNREDIITLLRNSRTSIILKIIHEHINRFDYQQSLEIIDTELLKIFDVLSENVIGVMRKLSLNYERADLFEIIQKTEVLTCDGAPLETLSTYDLLNTVLESIKTIQEYNPERILIVTKNIDHMVTRQEYHKIVERMYEISYQTDTYFACSLSIIGYTHITELLCEGITVFNDVVFSLPEADRLYHFIVENYPVVTNLSKDTFFSLLEVAINNIGASGEIASIECEVIRKLINKTLAITNKLECPINPLFLAFLQE